MCVIAVARDGEYPDNSTIRSMWQKNPHGAGIAYLHPEESYVHFEKGLMTLSQVLDAVDRVETAYQNAECLPVLAMHFRLGTVGPNNQSLTHPFPVDYEMMDDVPLKGTTKRILMHNGHWGNWENVLLEIASEIDPEPPLPDGFWSDSRAMAYLASLFPEPNTDSEKELFTKTIPSGKVFIMQAEEEGSGRLQYYGNWHETHYGASMRVSNKFYIRTNQYNKHSRSSGGTGYVGSGYSGNRNYVGTNKSPVTRRNQDDTSTGNGRTTAANPGETTDIVKTDEITTVDEFRYFDKEERPARLRHEFLDIELDYLEDTDMYWSDNPPAYLDPADNRLEVLDEDYNSKWSQYT